MIKVAIDIINKSEKIDQKGNRYFDTESKYHLTNKYSPKKCPDLQQFRSKIKPLYSYSFYARPEYFENIDKEKREAELAV